MFSETDFLLRYEKGTFQSGYCILNETRIAIVNKYYSLDGKINSLLEIIKQIDVDEKRLSEKNRKLYQEITQQQLQF